MTIQTANIETLGGTKKLIWNENNQHASRVAKEIQDFNQGKHWVKAYPNITNDYGCVVNAAVVQKLIQEETNEKVSLGIATVFSGVKDTQCDSSDDLFVIEISISSNAIILDNLE